VAVFLEVGRADGLPQDVASHTRVESLVHRAKHQIHQVLPEVEFTTNVHSRLFWLGKFNGLTVDMI